MEKEKVNILMVDDQPAKLMAYEAILGELNENLIKATTLSGVLEHLLRKDIGVVLMDVSMPEMDGFQMAEIIRQHPRFQKTAIIFVSAVHLTDGDRLKGYRQGAVDYIAVPVVPEVLRAKVGVFAELHRKSREAEVLNAELRRLSASLITMQDDERRRIARELHDGLGQDLTAIKILLQGVNRELRGSSSPVVAPSLPSGGAGAGNGNPEPGAVGDPLASINRLLDGAIQQIRSMSYLLHPPLLDEMGLRSALAWYLEGLSKRGPIKTALTFEPVEFPRLASELETALFRIIQEALSNVFRHSRAGHASVTLLYEGARIAVTVQDDGVGVLKEVADFRPERMGVGIGGMRQRVKELGGELRLRNASPGTVVEVVIPMAQRPPAHPHAALVANGK